MTSRLAVDDAQREYAEEITTTLQLGATMTARELQKGAPSPGTALRVRPRY